MHEAFATLASRFRPLQDFKAKAGGSYSLLPFRFLPLAPDRYLLTNFVGEYLVLPKELVHLFIQHRLPIHSDSYNNLKARHFLLDGDSTVPIDLLAAKYRTRQAFLPRFTSLFMLVTTLRCNHSCTYCQVSGRSEHDHQYDMTEEVADRAIEFAFRTPSPAIKIEFQGGESLLNLDLVKYVVCSVEKRSESEHRDVEFVIATNLSGVTDDALLFFRDHRVFISTSLDGPADLHNRNRPSIGHDSYAEVTHGIHRAMTVLGAENVSALMTTTHASLTQPKEIIDEYLRQGLSSIFLRSLNPYGRATGLGLTNDYTVEEWLQFYRDALSYILALNQRGIVFREEFTTILLRKMLTPFATGYVDLQSPAGIGIGGIVVNYDGNVYCSDESRMLAEMGDHTFLMGNVLTDSYRDIMLSDALLDPLGRTMTECVPQCADCAIQPYCGSDPVRHYRMQGDVVGFKPTSEFCRKHMAVVQHLVHLLEEDAAASILRTWI